MSLHAITTAKSPSPLHLLRRSFEAQLSSALPGDILDLDVQLTELYSLHDRPDGVWKILTLVHSNSRHARLQFQHLAPVPDREVAAPC